MFKQLNIKLFKHEYSTFFRLGNKSRKSRDSEKEKGNL